MGRLESGLAYVRHGWSVIPITPGQKTPLIGSWLEYQRRLPAEAEVTEWFAKWPDASIAVIVGRISGLVVIDIDDPVVGEQSFRQCYGPVITLAAKTPKGMHYYFKHPGDREISNSIRAAPGLDVKADGGYVLAPPSIGYRWIKHPIVELPQPVARRRVDLTDEAPIVQGGRNDALTRKVGKLLAMGHSPAETLAMCRAFNLAYCRPPLTEGEVRAIVDSIAAREAHKQPPKTGFNVAPFRAVQEEAVEWIWPGVLPKGKLTLFIGDPGHGKSLLSVEIAACMSAGKEFPDGTTTDPSNVLMVFCEDGAGDTVKPRLRVAGAALDRVMHLTVNGRFMRLDTDLANLAEAIKQTQAKLLTIDPISAYLGNVNSWKDDEVRRLLAGVGELAAQTQCAILCIMHLNKKVSSNAIDRGMGSVAFTAVARSVFLIGSHPEEHDSRKILAPVKANLVETVKSRMFRIQASDHIPYIEWDGATEYTARQILLREITGLDETSNLERAVRFIEDQLKNGEKAAKEIYDLGVKQGLSESIITTAKTQLEVKSNRRDNTSFWVLQHKHDLGF